MTLLQTMPLLDSSKLLAAESNDIMSEDPFEDSMIEVYGPPPTKQPCHLSVASPNKALNPLPLDSQHSQAVSEELPVSHNPTLINSTYNCESQSSN